MAGTLKLPPYETIALVLQGGGALGAYQAGVFEGLQDAGIPLNHLAGISIGALNTAIIAGNPPAQQVDRLREFWETICRPNLPFMALPPDLEQYIFSQGNAARQWLGHMNATRAILDGQNGFFQPRMRVPLLPFTHEAPTQTSFYSIDALKQTLEKLCDFDRINDSGLHVSVGAVNVRSGNFVQFDNKNTRLGPEHFMASSALPPVFPPVEIDGELYWDGGLVSNTPLASVLKQRPMRHTLVFQVDLWSARGSAPTNMGEVHDRMQDIRYSSRTRFVTEYFRQAQELRHQLSRALQALPEEMRNRPEYALLAQEAGSIKNYNIVHLIFRNQPHDLHYKDHQFGLASMREHWKSGLNDIRRTLLDPSRLAMPDPDMSFVTHDVHQEELDERMKR